MIMTAHRMQPTASTELMTMTDAEHGAHGMHYVVFEQVRYLKFRISSNCHYGDGAKSHGSLSRGWYDGKSCAMEPNDDGLRLKSTI